MTPAVTHDSEAFAIADAPGIRSQLGNDPHLEIGMVIFDDMTNLDFVGPCDIFGRVPGAGVHVLAKTLDPVRTDSGHRILADKTFAEAPPLDVLFVPGGAGTLELMEDSEVLEFLRHQAGSAIWITSVCTGALVLGAAGLLDGYRATTHWAARDILPVFGAIPVGERVVVDRDRITGGGVTAGIDFGLQMVAMIWGQELAQFLQLGMEYDPHPPFDSGSPDRAPMLITQSVRTALASVTAARTAAAERAMARLNSADGGGHVRSER